MYCYFDNCSWKTCSLMRVNTQIIPTISVLEMHCCASVSWKDWIVWFNISMKYVFWNILSFLKPLYVLYSPQTCTKDEECCAGQLCVWGQCANSTKGDAGTLCQYQSDCKEELCCAFHKGMSMLHLDLHLLNSAYIVNYLFQFSALLFPVCSSKPIERERCIISANHLMELLSWDFKGEGPQEHCPCAGDLQCHHLG